MLKQVFVESMERQFKRNSYSSTTYRLKKTMRETISSNCRQGFSTERSVPARLGRDIKLPRCRGFL